MTQVSPLVPEQRASPLAAFAGGLARLDGDQVVVWPAEVRHALGAPASGIGTLADGSLLVLAGGDALRLRETLERFRGHLSPGVDRSRVFAGPVPDAFQVITPARRYALYRYQLVGGEARLTGRAPMEGDDHRTAVGLADGSVVHARAGLRRIRDGRPDEVAPLDGTPWHLAPGPADSVWASFPRAIQRIRLDGTRVHAWRTEAEMIVHLDGDADGVAAIVADAPLEGGRDLRLVVWDAEGTLRWQTPLSTRGFVRVTPTVVAVGDEHGLAVWSRAEGRPA